MADFPRDGNHLFESVSSLVFWLLVCRNQDGHYWLICLLLFVHNADAELHADDLSANWSSQHGLAEGNLALWGTEYAPHSLTFLLQIEQVNGWFRRGTFGHVFR